MNGSGIVRWEADAVPLETIFVSVDWTINIDCTINSVFFGPDEYSLNWTITGSGTVDATFTREDLDPDDPTTVSANAFSIARGETYAGDPVGVTYPFFRSVFSNIYPKDNTPEDGPIFQDTSNTWSVNWAETYTPIGASPPSSYDTSGTDTGTIIIQVELHQNGNQIEWSVAAFFEDLQTGPAWPPGGFGATGTGDGTIGPWTVTVHDLKKSGAVDIGGVANYSSGSPTWDTINAYTDTKEITVACS